MGASSGGGMTDLDMGISHVLTPPIQAKFSGTWVGFCSCGQDFVKATEEEVREAGRPHREAEAQRVGHVDRERDEARRLRREARREQRRSQVTDRRSKA
jgi:hypothetical protein